MQASQFAVRVLIVVGVIVISCLPAGATDRDGANDCTRPVEDWGDAPECIPAYPSGIMGHFPNCSAACGIGDQTNETPLQISTPPGPTGFVRHVQGPNGFWLGCYAVGTGPFGIDSEADGKVNTPSIGSSACALGLSTDCAELAFGSMTFDQDECKGDGSDAGLVSFKRISEDCSTADIQLSISFCQANQQTVYLNMCLDMNQDGDWNDSFLFGCGSPFDAHEWMMKNHPVIAYSNCMSFHFVSIRIRPTVAGPAWLRMSVTSEPVPDDYPWNGSAGLPGEALIGGETEDDPVMLVPEGVTRTESSTWGRMKTLYR
jgi:hypothetical protein